MIPHGLEHAQRNPRKTANRPASGARSGAPAPADLEHAIEACDLPAEFKAAVLALVRAAAALAPR
jgi:hypothetical protein